MGLLMAWWVSGEAPLPEANVSLLLGCEVDTFQDDRPAWQGDKQPRVRVLLGPEGEGLAGERCQALACVAFHSHLDSWY